NAGTTYECGNQGPSVKKSRSVSYIAEEERMSFINNLVSGSGQENVSIPGGHKRKSYETAKETTKVTTEDINKMQYIFFQKQNELSDVQIRSFAAMKTFFKCATEKMQEKEQSFSQTLAGFMVIH
ncbi:hypothetical protein MAR_027451, partial [Mya arenaria]